MSRDINKATPWMRDFFLCLQSETKARLGINIIPIQVDRTAQYQLALYAQGREPLDKVNRLRKIVGQAPISEKENSRKVTWTLCSDHIIDLTDNDLNNNLSKAIDIGIIGADGKYYGSDKADVNEDNEKDYLQIGEIAKLIAPNVDWGGDWIKKKDFPHYAHPKGVSLTESFVPAHIVGA